MSNMSYCRYQNTLSDLKDCFAEEDNPVFCRLSQDERNARRELLDLMASLVDQFGDEKYPSVEEDRDYDIHGEDD